MIAQVDPEEFFDFQANRPTIRLTEGQSREIEWPGNVLLSATPAGAERDLVLLAGTEPNLRWRTFADGIADAAEMLGVEMVVTLALIADVAHTLPVPITGLASDEELVDRLDLTRSNYEGPTGVVGRAPRFLSPSRDPLGEPLGRGPSLRRRGAQPEGGPGAAARLEGLVGVAVEASGLEEESDSYESQVSRAVAANPEIEELVQRLEAEQADRLDVEDDVPSGESLARDFERYLRQQGSSPDA